MKDREDGAAGKRIGGAKGHRVQVRAIRPGDFTPAKRTVFLNTLAATCNVSASARAAGISPVTVHHLRRVAPDFAALWAEALEIGYQYLEEQLLARAIEGVEALAIDPTAAPIPPLPPLPGPDEAGVAPSGGEREAAMNRGLPPAYQLALQVLGRRRAATERGTRFGRRPAMTTREVDALLLDKLDRLDRQEAVRAARTRPATGTTPADGSGTKERDGEGA